MLCCVLAMLSLLTSTQVELLVHKVVALKKSRDKLLEQLDGQSVEMEQLMADNQVCH